MCALKGMCILFCGSAELSLITLHWFLTSFASVVDIRVLLRIWDLLFYEGSVVLFQVTLGMLKIKVGSHTPRSPSSSHAAFHSVCSLPLFSTLFISPSFPHTISFTLLFAHFLPHPSQTPNIHSLILPLTLFFIPSFPPLLCLSPVYILERLLSALLKYLHYRYLAVSQLTFS